MDLKNILVIGSRGMLGKQIVKKLKNAGYQVCGLDRHVNKDINLTTHIQFDLLNKTAFETLNLSTYEAIIHCAANVDLDSCENDPDKAYMLHQEATNKLLALTSPNTYFIYISTDSVFDGIQNIYSEQSVTNPLNTYALSKLAGEKEVLDYKNGLVIRTNIYGLNDPLKNSLAEWVIQTLEGNTNLTGFDDVIFNPLYTRQLSEIIVSLLKHRATGILHLGSNKPVSKYEFINDLAKELTLPLHLIQKGRSEEFLFKIKRPKNTYLDCKKAESIVGAMPTLQKGLEMLKHDFKLLRNNHGSIYNRS